MPLLKMPILVTSRAIVGDTRHEELELEAACNRESSSTGFLFESNAVGCTGVALNVNAWRRNNRYEQLAKLLFETVREDS